MQTLLPTVGATARPQGPTAGANEPMPSTLHALLHHPALPEHRAWVREPFAAGEYVFRLGESGHDVYLVLRGRVRVLGRVDLEDGQRVRPGYLDLGERQVFGALSLFDRSRRCADVQAISDCEIAVIDAHALATFMEQNPQLGYRILRELFSCSVEQIRKNRHRVASMLAWGLKAHGITQCLPAKRTRSPAPETQPDLDRTYR
ncbi:MAG: cyclic nucleotide-binding domain-containing protein [Gammaproteobacteria bacterium]